MTAQRFDFERAWAGGGSEPGGGGAEPLQVVSLADVEELPVEWLAEGFLPFGALTLLVGRGGLGKTCLGIYLGARLTRGQPIFPGIAAAGPADVLVVSAEDAIERVIRPRARLAGADLARFHAVDLAEADLALPDDAAALRATVERLGAHLVIVDPLSAFLGGRIDSHRDASLRGALRPLYALAEATGAAVLGIVHVNKSGSQDVAQATSGSAAWVNAARSALVFGRKPDGPETDPARIVAVGKSNYGPTGIAHELSLRVPDGEAHPTISYVGPSGVSSAELLRLPEGDHGEGGDAREAILEVLVPGRPLLARELERQVVEGYGIGRHRFQAARSVLRAEGLIDRRQPGRAGERGGGRVEWFLTDAGAAIRFPTPLPPGAGEADAGEANQAHSEAGYRAPGAFGSPPPGSRGTECSAEAAAARQFRDRHEPQFGPSGPALPSGSPDPFKLLSAAGLDPSEEAPPAPGTDDVAVLADGAGWAVAVERRARPAGGS